jgi:CRP-like cAMP-binding protein
VRDGLRDGGKPVEIVVHDRLLDREIRRLRETAVQQLYRLLGGAPRLLRIRDNEAGARNRIEYRLEAVRIGVERLEVARHLGLEARIAAGDERRSLADMTGANRQTVTKILGELRREGALSINRRRINIESAELLDAAIRKAARQG